MQGCKIGVRTLPNTKKKKKISIIAGPLSIREISQ